MKERYLTRISTSMTDYVLSKSETEISTWTIWIPVAMLSMQSELTLG